MTQQDWLNDIQMSFSAAGFSRPQPAHSTRGSCYEMVCKTNPNAIVQFYSTLPSKEGVRDLYRCADAGVFPYFAEGWGLSTMEMMAMGKPVAATDWGAPCQYLTGSDVFYPIQLGHEAQAYDGKWFLGNKGKWFQLSVDGLLQVIHGNIITAVLGLFA